MALDLAMIILLSLLPISELRGAIPYGLASGINPILVFVLAVASNILVIPITFFFLNFVHHHLVHVKLYASLFDKFVARTRKKAHKYTEKYGWFGLTLFVAIPLPITGAYTGTLAAWLLGIDVKRSMLALSVGVLIAGIIITSLSVGLDLFINSPN